MGDDKNRDQLETGEIYHVFNRGVNRKTVFPDHQTRTYFIRLLGHCKKYITPLTQHSQKAKVHGEEVFRLSDPDDDSKPLRFRKPVGMHAYMVMPNHFHLLLQQLVDGGISWYINRICNAYTRSFNQRFKRRGPLWERRFSAKLVGDESSYLQVIRYIHLNPLNSHNFKFKDPAEYPYSSYLDTIDPGMSSVCDRSLFLEPVTKPDSYRSFVLAGITPEEAHSLIDLTVEDWFEE